LSVLGVITLSSCGGLSTFDAYDGPRRSDAEVAFVRTVLNTNAHSSNVFDCISIEKVNGAAVKSMLVAPNVRVLPGSHSFEVETSYKVSSSSVYIGSLRTTTNYKVQRWLLTFPVTAGSTYHIMRGYELDVPPGVYQIGDPSEVGKMPSAGIVSVASPYYDRLNTWYSKQKMLAPQVRQFSYKKGRKPQEFYLPEPAGE
jgi:hypothetical protein